MDVQKLTLSGGETLPALARVYPQLYLTPGPEAREAYDRIVLCGEDAPAQSLAHFQGSERDSLEYEETPAGAVPVITLARRADFERFLQIMGFKCTPRAIPPTQGASILDGVVNWTKIRAHKAAYLRENGPDADWESEFRRFTADGANYRDALIILSVGPYSAVPPEETGFSGAEWLRLSHRIRKAHECTHFICRRLFPERKDAVWDELVADAVGLYAAFGRYDLRLAERFLGVGAEGYRGGRLENYAGEEDLNTLAKKVHRTLEHLERVICGEAMISGQRP